MGFPVKIIDKLELIPRGEYIVVKVDKEEPEKTAGGIIIPTAALANKKTQTGTIIAVGPGRRDPQDTSKLIPMDCAVGDRILFAAYIGYPYVIKQEEYIIIKHLDIMSNILEESHMIDSDDERYTPDSDRAVA